MHADDGERIEMGDAPGMIDPHEHRAAMYALGKLDTLGMAWNHHPPTAGLMSYLHDPARQEWRWNSTLTFGGDFHETTFSRDSDRDLDAAGVDATSEFGTESGGGV